ncbi:uncharacterized protein LOC26528617 isoform X1 [Drosophila mojavensis]|uniref:Uncharacterized protein, isoform B n=1 Tax=Drosophila mojavensis TaxID=7230 RepID=A0A0Q9XPM6_DROMO|nr:uncharacterized protein LOC26528617 isoform X1 [Drosophila mojavensis]KRG06407.1 uncharacterized protein Dmoj_GI26976, isoform B [Drosophila mojavensis]
MFQMLPYDHQLCLMAYSYKLDLNACRRPVEQKDLSMDKVLIMHRILLLSCLIAVIKGVVDFVKHYCSPRTKLSTLWQNDRFLVLQPATTRKCRCAISFIHLNFWLVLTYATVSFTPSLMLPWLIYYYALLSLRLMKFGLKAAENKLKGERLKAAVVLSNLIFKIAFVTFCKKDFQAVLDTIST